jgi:6-phosphogluconolactonase
MRLPNILVIGTVLCVSACGGGNGSGSVSNVSGTTKMYMVGGHAAGLLGSGLTLSINGSAPISIGNNGAFTLSSVEAETNYNVSISTQPTNPAQTCTVSNSEGTITSADVFSVLVFCPQSVPRFAAVMEPGFAGDPNPTVLGKLETYAIDPSTGALSLIAGSTVPAGPTPFALIQIPNSSLAMSISYWNSGSMAPIPWNISTVFAYSVDSATGVASVLNGGAPYTQLASPSSSGCNVPGAGVTQTLSFTPNGNFGYVGNVTFPPYSNAGDWQFSWNTTTGAPSIEGNALLGCQAPGPVTIEPSGRFAYIPAQNQPTPDVATAVAIFVYSIDQTTGDLTQVSSATVGTVPGGGTPISPVVVDPYGRFAYQSQQGQTTIYEFTIDPTSGALTAVAGSPLSTGAAGEITIDPTGSYLFTKGSDGVTAFAINPATGALTLAPATSFVSVSPVGFGISGTAALHIDPSAQFAYLAGEDPSAGSGGTAVYGYSLDSSTGVLTPLAGSPFAAGVYPNAVSDLTILQ